MNSLSRMSLIFAASALVLAFALPSVQPAAAATRAACIAVGGGCIATSTIDKCCAGATCVRDTPVNPHGRCVERSLPNTKTTPSK